MSGEPCPQCGGRKVISVGVHEVPCAECDGAGTVNPPKPTGGSKRGATKPTT